MTFYSVFGMGGAFRDAKEQSRKLGENDDTDDWVYFPKDCRAGIVTEANEPGKEDTMNVDIQLRMFSDPIKDAMAASHKAAIENLDRNLSHTLAKVRLSHYEEVERRNESYRKFLQELDFTRAQLLSVITAHADRLEDVRQVMREMSERVQKRQEPGPADTGQNPSAIVFPVAVPGPPDQDSVQYQPGLPWPDVE